MSKNEQRARTWGSAAIAAGAVAAVFLVVFVPTYLIVHKQNGSRSSSQSPAQHAEGLPCSGLQLPLKQQQALLYPETSRKPNFIYILLDDLGYDDVRLHHPSGGMHKYITTPNINKLLLQSMEFNNFYTTPMCSTSRAELLTGRWYPRTAAMYINTGWDFIHLNETLLPKIMAQEGYKTAVFGKWHNGRTAGYQPYDVGFQDSFLPTPYVHTNNVIFINGNSVKTKGWLEDVLMEYAVNYLKERKSDGKPFFMYYPAFSVHAGWMTSSYAGDRYQRPAPPKYINKYSSLPLNVATAHLYAMLEFMDLQIGRLLSFLDSSGLAEHTYVMLSGDNGPALFSTEAKHLPRAARMPSGMQGAKHSVLEGGIRNFLAVRGPGVPQGATSDALTGLVDVLPTIVDLAGVKEVSVRDSWDGISLANLIRRQPHTQQQQERVIFSMETGCIEEDFVPLLGPDRRVMKSQQLLNFTSGGVNGKGFKRCVGVRYKNYKWLADARKTGGIGNSYMAGREVVPTALYRFKEGRHIELPCQEASISEPAVAVQLENAAAQWWQDMLASPHSFAKATFYIGLKNRPGANIVADGAIERTKLNVYVLPMGLSGFRRKGDAAYFRVKVATAGTYSVSLFYQSNQTATFRLLLGPYESIKAGMARSITANVPLARDKRIGFELGTLDLPSTPPGESWEVKLEMLSNSNPGQPVIEALDTIYFLRQGAPHSSVLQYIPDQQEGVKTWKMTHGYKHVLGG